MENSLPQLQHCSNLWNVFSMMVYVKSIIKLTSKSALNCISKYEKMKLQYQIRKYIVSRNCVKSDEEQIKFLVSKSSMVLAQCSQTDSTSTSCHYCVVKSNQGDERESLYSRCFRLKLGFSCCITKKQKELRLKGIWILNTIQSLQQLG